MVQEPPVLSRDREGLFENAPSSSSLLQAMEPLILIAFPFPDSQILATPATGLALQGGCISGTQQSEGLLRVFWATMTPEAHPRWKVPITSALCKAGAVMVVLEETGVKKGS